MFYCFISPHSFLQEFTFDMYFRQFWNDPRLAFNQSDKLVLSGSQASDLMRQIWIPDTFFANAKTGNLHELSVPNHFVRISPQTGDILCSTR